MKKLFIVMLFLPAVAHAGYSAEVEKIVESGGMEGFKFFNVRCTNG